MLSLILSVQVKALKAELEALADSANEKESRVTSAELRVASAESRVAKVEKRLTTKSCGCKSTYCESASCGCKKAGAMCGIGCKCGGPGLCVNPSTYDDADQVEKARAAIKKLAQDAIDAKKALIGGGLGKYA
jgi:hypothetical protein